MTLAYLSVRKLLGQEITATYRLEKPVLGSVHKQQFNRKRCIKLNLFKRKKNSLKKFNCKCKRDEFRKSNDTRLKQTDRQRHTHTSFDFLHIS
jgi:hypothetical protein